MAHRDMNGSDVFVATVGSFKTMGPDFSQWIASLGSLNIGRLRASKVCFVADVLRHANTSVPGRFTDGERILTAGFLCDNIFVKVDELLALTECYLSEVPYISRELLVFRADVVDVVIDSVQRYRRDHVFSINIDKAVEMFRNRIPPEAVADMRRHLRPDEAVMCISQILSQSLLAETAKERDAVSMCIKRDGMLMEHELSL